MEMTLHLPRQSEAKMTPQLEEDLVVTPRFYKRAGLVPVLHFSVDTARGTSISYVLFINAGTGQLRLERLKEVIPLCDDDYSREVAYRKKSKELDSDDNTGGSSDDPIVEDEDVR